MGEVATTLYLEEVEMLKLDDIVIVMACDVWQGLDKGLICCLDDLRQDDGSPRYDFLASALNHYILEGGVDNKSVGGISRAVLALLEEWGVEDMVNATS